MMRGKCVEGRWWESVFAALPDGECLWSTGSNDYQGQVRVLCRLDAGGFLAYVWDYGSCSGCDKWEDSPDADAEIARDVQQATVLETPAILGQFYENAPGWFDRQEETTGELPWEGQ